MRGKTAGRIISPGNAEERHRNGVAHHYRLPERKDMRRFDRCECCGGPVTEKKVTVDIRRKEELFVFENVPVGVCTKCGERFYPGPVLERLNEIAAHRELVTSTIKVPRLDFAEAVD